MADDAVDKFIEEQKVKLVQDKAELENDPPYMEMKDKESEELPETSNMLISMAKENIPPNNQQNCPLGDYGLSLPLGEEYEQKKHRLREELRQDYKQYLSQGISQAKRKKNYLTTGEVDPYTQGLSLPIDERRSAQNEMEKNKRPITATGLQPERHTEVQPCNTGAEHSKKDVFTSTEGCEELLNKRWLEEDRHHRIDDETELRNRLLNKRLDEDLDVPNQRHRGFASQSGIPVRKYHRLDEDRDFGRRYYRMDCDPGISEEMDPRFRCESTYDRKTPRVFYAERPYLDRRVKDLSADYEDNLKERALVQQNLRTGNSRNQVQISSAANEQAKSAPVVPYATGLVVGGQDRELLQRRKEKYRQELIQQMAEQQRNKRREKDLKLLVAASGAQDPEKQPNRLQQFGLTARASGETTPPERPRVAFHTPVPLSAASTVNEEFHRGIASTLGERAAPRLPPIPPPPPPPVLTDNYKTPYDDAYSFYGARNPLDPNLAYCGIGMMGMKPTPNLDPALSQAPVEQSVSNIGRRNAGDRQRSIGLYSEEKTKPSKEATLFYQQELQQQIREREERRRQEREERERQEAKLQAEMRNYNPWGKGGGGAPLRDAEGNLIADLNMMHKQNENAYHNPQARLNEDKKAVVSFDPSLASPRPENTETSKIAVAQTSPFARGNVFGEPPTPEHLKRQESYKNFLRLQIEEKRRREEAEREKLRLEEEIEEKRIAEQRMKMQKAYEEEQEARRRKEEERRLKAEEITRLEEERQKEAERIKAEKKREKEKEEEQLRQQREKEKAEEEKKMFSRQPTPVIPAPQNKWIREEERIPSPASQISSYAKNPPQPRVPSPPVPARRNELLAAEERKNVIKKLSQMRKHLRSEDQRLQAQLQNMTSDDDVPITRNLSRGRREKNPKDIFEMARLRRQAPVRRHSSKETQDPVNMQNILEFNDLKYNDSDTRMGLRRMYPDPPKDDQTLEIQQQALLREQQKKLDRMRIRRQMEDDGFSGDNPQITGQFRTGSNEFLKSSLLESDSAFIGANGETFLDFKELNLSRQPPLTARERRRLKQKALECAENVPPNQTPLLQRDGISPHSNFSLDMAQLKGKNEERLHRLTELQQKPAHLGDTLSLGDADDLLRRAPSDSGGRSSSVDTIATEPWLRPGTSEMLQRFLAEQSSPAKLSPENSFPLSWHGLSTAHG